MVEEHKINIDDNTTVDELTEMVIEYRQENNLDKYDSVEELIKAISVEAGELLNEITLKDPEYTVVCDDEVKNTNATMVNALNIHRELADVLIYCIALVNYIDVDMASLITEKIKYNIRRNRSYEP